MPIRNVQGTGLGYWLIPFDKAGHELPVNGEKVSAELGNVLASASPPVTDVFLLAHGWNNDVGDALRSYDKWMRTIAETFSEANPPGIRPVFIGIHWPSKAWGDERLITESPHPDLLATEHVLEPHDVAASFATLLELDDQSRATLARLLDAESQHPGEGLTDAMCEDVRDLHTSLGLADDTLEEFPPEILQPNFDPRRLLEAVERCLRGDDFGIEGKVSDGLMTMVRVFSFWTMKKRARPVGERGVRDLLRIVQTSTTKATRVHTAGHSFGCIVGAGAVAGNARQGGAPIDSMLLIQGALSLWCFADVIKDTGHHGYFRAIVDQSLVRGPIVTVRSHFDRALRVFYPMGARFNGDLGFDYPPDWGATGTFGAHGRDSSTVDADYRAALDPQFLSRGRIHNLEASDLIRRMNGIEGAHNDVHHPEVVRIALNAATA